VETPVQMLAAVQEKDIAILKLRNEIRDIPARKTELEGRNSQKKEALSKLNEKLKNIQSQMKQVEIEIEAERQRILKLREQQLQLKSNKEFKAMEDEVKGVEVKIGTLEEKELGFMENIEACNQDIASAKGDLDMALAQTARETAALDQRVGEIEGKVTGLLAERAVLAEKVDKKWLSRYESMFQNRQDRVLVLVEHRTCGGCHMTLAPHLIHDAKRNNVMTACPFCGNLIYSI